MNVMLASGHYPWTIIPVERRNEYMEALEQASADQNIIPLLSLLLVVLSSIGFILRHYGELQWNLRNQLK